MKGEKCEKGGRRGRRMEREQEYEKIRERKMEGKSGGMKECYNTNK